MLNVVLNDEKLGQSALECPFEFNIHNCMAKTMECCRYHYFDSCYRDWQLNLVEMI